MFERITNIDDNIVALRITDSITPADAETIERLLLKRAAADETIRLLIVVDEYASFNSAEDLLFDMAVFKKNSDRIQKMAVVGRQAWKNTWIALFGLFGGIQAAYFTREQVGAAVDWLREN